MRHFGVATGRIRTGARVCTVDNSSASNRRMENGATAIARELERQHPVSQAARARNAKPIEEDAHIFKACFEARGAWASVIRKRARVNSTGQRLVARKAASMKSGFIFGYVGKIAFLALGFELIRQRTTHSGTLMPSTAASIVNVSSQCSSTVE